MENPESQWLGSNPWIGFQSRLEMMGNVAKKETVSLVTIRSPAIVCSHVESQDIHLQPIPRGFIWTCAGQNTPKPILKSHLEWKYLVDAFKVWMHLNIVKVTT